MLSLLFIIIKRQMHHDYLGEILQTVKYKFNRVETSYSNFTKSILNYWFRRKI